MRPLLLLILIITSLVACRPGRLARRLPGTWNIDHYDTYAVRTDSSTGHALDDAGTVSFSRSGRTGRQLRAGWPAGHLPPYNDRRWALQDSLLLISDAAGAVQEEWLVTKDLQYYLELVSVNPTRDTVRTMYLHK